MKAIKLLMKIILTVIIIYIVIAQFNMLCEYVQQHEFAINVVTYSQFFVVGICVFLLVAMWNKRCIVIGVIMKCIICLFIAVTWFMQFFIAGWTWFTKTEGDDVVFLFWVYDLPLLLSLLILIFACYFIYRLPIKNKNASNSNEIRMDSNGIIKISGGNILYNQRIVLIVSLFCIIVALWLAIVERGYAFFPVLVLLFFALILLPYSRLYNVRYNSECFMIENLFKKIKIPLEEFSKVEYTGFAMIMVIKFGVKRFYFLSSSSISHEKFFLLNDQSIELTEEIKKNIQIILSGKNVNSK